VLVWEVDGSELMVDGNPPPCGVLWLSIKQSTDPLLRKEKDETSPSKLSLGGFVEFPPFFVCEAGGFLFSKIFRLRAGLSIVKTVRVENYFSRTKLKDQHNEESLFRAGIGRLVSRIQITGHFAG
jgi:hypothetical protein